MKLTSNKFGPSSIGYVLPNNIEINSEVLNRFRIASKTTSFQNPEIKAKTVPNIIHSTEDTFLLINLTKKVTYQHVRHYPSPNRSHSIF